MLKVARGVRNASWPESFSDPSSLQRCRFARSNGGGSHRGYSGGSAGLCWLDDRPFGSESLYADLAAPVHRQQRVDATGIETLAREVLDDLQRLFRCMRLLVGPVGRQCVERIRDRDDARQQRNLVPLKSIRISTAVQGFVVQLDARHYLCELRYGAQNVCTLGRVRLHDFKFFFGQCARFLQNVILNADLAYIMKLRGNLEYFHEGRIELQLLRNQ